MNKIIENKREEIYKILYSFVENGDVKTAQTLVLTLNALTGLTNGKEMDIRHELILTFGKICSELRKDEADVNTKYLLGLLQLRKVLNDIIKEYNK